MSVPAQPVPRGVVRTVIDHVRARHLAAGAQRRPSFDGETHDYIRELVERAAPLLDPDIRHHTIRRVLAELSGFGVLEQYLDDPEVTEVAVNRGHEVWVDRNGQMELVDHLGDTSVDSIVERIITPLGLRFDLTAPIVDARLPGGHRMCAIREPLAVDGTSLSIRRFALRTLDLHAHAGSDVAALLDDIMRRRLNIVVCGAASSGKTTLLNALTTLIDASERVITVEDTAELSLACPNLVRLETRPATPDGVEEVSVRRLLQSALRLRPDRLVVGEVRGAEAFDMVQALNTGHDGSLSTIHANSPDDALWRLTALAALGAPSQAYESLSRQVRSSIDIVVHTARRGDGRRCIVSVAETQHDGAPIVLADHARVITAPTRRRVHLLEDSA